MIKKAYFLMLLPIAIIPMTYMFGDSFNLLNRTQLNQFLVRTIGNKTVENATFTSTPIPRNFLHRTTIKTIKTTFKTSTTLNTSTPAPTTKIFKVQLQNFNFVLGPTSDFYNKTPASVSVGKNLAKDVTVVSAYFKLPPFPKGSRSSMRKPGSYEKWMTAFQWILNPIVIYTDDNKTATMLTTMFQKRNRTLVKVILIQRKELWSFQQMPVISKILKQKGYPVHYPNTVIPAYNCMTHSKFEVLQKSIGTNFFKTRYFMWVDIGYFRDPVVRDFGLDIPEKFDERRVGITVVGSLGKNIDLDTSIRKNLNWVAGGCVLGRIDVLRTFCKEYLDFVKQGIKQKKIGVEQQMMYAMYSGKNKPKTSFQLCSPGWFCMGRLSAQAWAIKHGNIGLRG